MRDTSIEAYYSIENLSEKQEKVYDVIRVIEPCTDIEISSFIGWPINRITPRRGELESMFLIEEYDHVKGRSGRMACRWIVKEKQLELF